MTAAEDDEVVGIGDDVSPIGDAPFVRAPMLQEAVHVEVGEQRADHPALRRAAAAAFATRHAPRSVTFALLDRSLEPPRYEHDFLRPSRAEKTEQAMLPLLGPHPAAFSLELERRARMLAHRHVHKPRPLPRDLEPLFAEHVELVGGDIDLDFPPHQERLLAHAKRPHTDADAHGEHPQHHPQAVVVVPVVVPEGDIAVALRYPHPHRQKRRGQHQRREKDPPRAGRRRAQPQARPARSAISKPGARSRHFRHAPRAAAGAL